MQHERPGRRSRILASLTQAEPDTSGAGAAVDVAEGDRTDAATGRARGARASQEDWDPMVHGGQYADGSVARFLNS